MNRSKLAGMILTGLMAAGLTAQEMRFAVPEYLPFTGMVDGKAAGIGVDLVGKILKDAGLTMVVHVVPNFSRCIAEVQNNTADGFFLGSQNDERDAVAVMSDQIMINNWVWVLSKKSALNPKDADFKEKAQVGVILNSNPHTWLKNNGFKITGTPNTSASLITMLEANRFDVILVPELVYLDAIKGTTFKADGYQVVLQAKQPFGMYISKQYIAAHPDFMAKLNAAIKKDAPK